MGVATLVTQCVNYIKSNMQRYDADFLKQVLPLDLVQQIVTVPPKEEDVISFEEEGE